MDDLDALRLPQVMRALLVRLMSSSMVPPDNDIAYKEAVYRLRKYLKPYAVRIYCRRNVGYWIEPEDKSHLRLLLELRRHGKLNDFGQSDTDSPSSRGCRAI